MHLTSIKASLGKNYYQSCNINFILIYSQVHHLDTVVGHPDG